MDTIIWYDK